MFTKTIMICVAVSTAMLAAQATHAAEPLVYYSFDDYDAVIPDESGHGYDGTLSGGVDFSDAGYSGGCFQFNGSDSYVQLERPIQDSFTITAWIKADVPGRGGNQAYEGSGLFWSDVGGVANDFVVAVLGTKLSFFNGNPDISVNSRADVVTGEWMHIAAVRDTTARTISVYIDGKLDNTVTHSNTGPLDAQAVLAIGANTLDGRYYTGLMDEVKIYDSVLSAADIRAMAPPKLKARLPSPADGTIGVGVPLFQWSKGETAVLHDVYLGTTPELTAADLKVSRTPMMLYYHTGVLTPGAPYYWRVDEIEADGVTTHTGDVWTFVTQALTAYYPGPADGANDAAPAPTLTWMPGQGAVKHHLYFGDNLEAVTQGTVEADQGELALAEATFAPGDLDGLSAYYWRVDEVLLGGLVEAGPVWTFVTYLPVDDFESYNDDEGTGTRIYETWLDGWVNNNGAQVGYIDSPFAEQKTVHGGLQSMPLDYNNVDEPFYSEAEREFSPVQDWTAGGADTLVLHVRGRSRNAPAPLYITLEDSSGQTATVAHPDPAAVTTPGWTRWRISLGDFAGVNPARVAKMRIGLGDRRSPTAGGAGRLFIDDIYVTRP